MAGVKLAKKRSFYGVVAVVFALSNMSTPVSAIGGVFDEVFYNKNYVLGYNPTLACSTSQGNIGPSNGSLTIPSYTNAVIKNGDHPDPGVIVGDDGELHMYTSGLRHFSSKDGVNWKGLKEADVKNAPGGDNAGAWAPDIAKVNDMYVLSWANPSGTIYYAVGDSAGGPFTYSGKLANEGIDPQIFADGGKYYLYYAGINQIKVAELTIHGNDIKAGSAKSVLNRDMTTEDWTVEAPWVFNRNGTYYMLYSTGKWDGGGGFDQDKYDLRVAKASSPTQKFTRKGGAILRQTSGKFTGPGTAAIISDKNGNDWLYYHARPNGGNDRAPMLDVITYKNGWPVINNGNGPSTSNQGSVGAEGSGATYNTPASSASFTSTGGGFRMATYNAAGVTLMRDGKLGRAQQNLNEGFQMLDRERATVASLQEVASSQNLKAPSGWSMYVSKGGNRSVGIAWRSDIWTQKEAIDFSVDNSPEPDNTAKTYHYPIVTLADRNGNIITVMSAHLVSSVHGAPGSLRVAQGEAVRDKIMELNRQGRSVVLGGDFNMTNPQIGNIMKPLVDSQPEYRRIDHIFATPGAIFTNWKDVPKEQTNGFTDHPLIFTDVTIPGSSFSALGGGVGAFCTCPASDTLSSSGMLRGKDNLEKIYNYFIDKGFSDVGAAGIVGNISQESGGDPTIVQGGGHSKDPTSIKSGWGIIQWTPGSKVIAIAKEAGAEGPIFELSTQLDIVWGHFQNKPPITKGSFSIEEYKAITDYRAATNYFEDKIEGASNPAMTKRYAAAKLALSNYGDGGGGVASGDPTAEGGCGSTENGAVRGDIVKTALAYAWPDRNVSPNTKKKPSYAAAIKKAKAAGKYTGDTCFDGGIDCGAFVTRVMQDSGVDPEYGGGGNTEYQLNYMLKNKTKYKELKPSGPSDLQPGDIAIQNNSSRHHTYLFVGKQDGFDSMIASASQCDHAPWAGEEKVADPAFRWFRYIGAGEGVTPDA